MGDTFASADFTCIKGMASSVDKEGTLPVGISNREFRHIEGSSIAGCSCVKIG